MFEIKPMARCTQAASEIACSLLTSITPRCVGRATQVVSPDHLGGSVLASSARWRSVPREGVWPNGSAHALGPA